MSEEFEKEASRYGRYMEEITEDITDIVQQFGCQPILFIGSGLSKRYFNAPSWENLLDYLATHCSFVDKGLGYYKQSLKSPAKIGEEFAARYHEWAWSSGRNEFPEDMFSPSVDAQAYIKFKIAAYLKSITPVDIKALKENGNPSEIDAVRRIKPHAIITTNYDQMIEILFPDLTPIIGQQILKGQQVAVGEIYKIHGCVSEFEGIVFTETDYNIFAKTPFENA